MVVKITVVFTRCHFLNSSKYVRRNDLQNDVKCDLSAWANVFPRCTKLFKMTHF